MSEIDINRDAAWALLTKYVASVSLRRHCLGVETAMRAYAGRFGESEEEWGFVGLIHDFDYEIHPTLDEHPQAGFSILRERGVPEWVIDAVASHADHLDVPRDTPLKKTLYAVDELSGFVIAVALVRPSRRVADVDPAAVRKKLKDKAFARAVSREMLLAGAADLGVEFDDLVREVVKALEGAADRLGLEGTAPA